MTPLLRKKTVQWDLEVKKGVPPMGIAEVILLPVKLWAIG